MPNIPAKLFDYRVLTLEAEVQTDLAGIFINNGPKQRGRAVLDRASLSRAAE
jgi:hypothetical protein